MTNKQKKITVLLGQEEFDVFDTFCRQNGFKKSTLLVRLMRDFLERETAAKAGPTRPFDRTNTSDRQA